ncbi:hypothetical protein BH10CYA1_BH10CYA1_27670 [soil metagenome]
MSEHPDIMTALAPFADRNLQFPNKPKIVDDLTIFPMPDGLGAQVRGLDKTIIFRGKLVDTAIKWLLSSLNGTLTPEEIVTSRPAACSPADIAEALLLLFRKGVICETASAEANAGVKADDEIMRRQILFWGRQVGATRSNKNGEQTLQKLRNQKIVLLGNGLFGAAAYDLLTRSGCEIEAVLDWNSDRFLSQSIVELKPKVLRSLDDSQSGAEAALNEWLPVADLLVTALRNTPSSLLESVNRLCIRHDCKWLHGHDNSSTVEIGPSIDPYATGCYSCMRIRQTSTHDYAIEEAMYDAQLNQKQSGDEPLGESIASATLAASILCEEAIRILTIIQIPAYHNAVLTLTRDGAFELNRFKRLPKCPDCYRGKHASFVEKETTNRIR